MAETYELIITEKPKVSQRVAEAIADKSISKEKHGKVTYYVLTHKGHNVIVAPAVGHVYNLKQKEGQKGYPIFDLEWIPSYESHKGAAFTKDYVKTLKMLAKKASSFTNACDYDIEGSLIGANVLRYAAGEEAFKNAQRMKFSSLTAKELEKAYVNKSKHLDFNMVDAGVARHILDWYWGVNTSRALSSAYKEQSGYYTTLSAGRVQTPTLKVLDDREQEIKKFIPEPFWVLNALLDLNPGELETTHEREKFFDKDESIKTYERCKDKDAVVQKIEKKKISQAPPTPFNLGDLQSEAYKQFKYTPKRTQMIAQILYEAGLISYPRTSSQQLPAEFDPKVLLQQLLIQPPYKPFIDKVLATPLKPNEGKKTDPAHPCILPTGEPPKTLPESDFKLYDLIVKRFFAIYGSAAIRETQKVTFLLGEEPFFAKGTRTLEKNWHELYAPYVKLEEEEMPAMKEGDTFNVDKLSRLKKETQPPHRYSQAAIIKKMEQLGIGTKATRANILQTLYDRNYILGTQIQVTDFGSQIVTTLSKYVPELTSEELTHKFESNMEQIRDGKLTSNEVITEAKELLIKIMEKFKANSAQIGDSISASYKEEMKTQRTLAVCNLCGKDLIVRRARVSRKQFVGCNGYPNCTNSYPLPQMAKIVRTDKLCEHDQLPIIEVVRTGKRKFVMCIDPKCPSKADWGKNKEEKTKVDEKTETKPVKKRVRKKPVPKKS